MRHSLRRSRVNHRVVGAALCVAALWIHPQMAGAGCSAVGCARVDWTEMSPVAEDGTATVDVHGAFAWMAPPAWFQLRMAGHFVAQCGPTAGPPCRSEVDALRDFVATQMPLSFDAPSDAFAATGEPLFLASEGHPIAPDEDGASWLHPSPQGKGSGLCGLAFDLARNQPTCPGDCDNSGDVTIDEVIGGVRMAVEGLPPDRCARMDVSGEGAVTVDEVVRAIRSALQGCS